MRRTSTLVLLAAAVALIAAGCGSSNNDNKSNTDSSAAATTATPAYAPKTTAAKSATGKAGEVRIENFAFSPVAEKVKVGQEIEWENYDSVAHNVIATSGGTFKSSTLQKGAKFKFTPTKAGTISYVCTFHPNMKATLEVTQ